MSDVYGYIYVLTNLINNKKYVGQTTRTFNERYNYCGSGAERMYNYHKYMKDHNYSYNKHLLGSFEKYGLKNFDVIEKYDIAYSKEELDEKEKYYISLFDSFKNGYNKTDGGTGEYSIVTTFKPDYNLKTDEERVSYVYEFLNIVYSHQDEITQKQIDNISDYLYNVGLKNVNQEENYRVLIDDMFQIKSYAGPERKRKRAKNGYYKEPKWCVIDKNNLNKNDNRKKYYKKITQKQLSSLKELKNKKMNIGIKAKIKIDIKDIENLKVNDCNIKQSTESKYYSLYINDKLKNVDIVYTKDVIRKVLKNWIKIEHESEINPYKTIHCIKMDFENIFNKLKLTNIQQQLLNDIKHGLVVDDGSRGNLQRIVEKIYKELNN